MLDSINLPPPICSSAQILPIPSGLNRLIRRGNGTLLLTDFRFYSAEISPSGQCYRTSRAKLEEPDDSMQVVSPCSAATSVSGTETIVASPTLPPPVIPFSIPSSVVPQTNSSGSASAPTTTTTTTSNPSTAVPSKSESPAPPVVVVQPQSRREEPVTEPPTGTPQKKTLPGDEGPGGDTGDPVVSTTEQQPPPLMQQLNRLLTPPDDLLQWKDMPQHLQFNPYVLTGYRPLQGVKGCLSSLFYLSARISGRVLWPYHGTEETQG
ncbi:conserved hypothetical protein [Culex quinquefasciatus]|uniref:Uncharacterized protein n=1 Tax=Culex quinquefasciatus TaxID=7176 RepID=B0WSW0_CULQU|nr:conserved hypothetical protein [Culex quinquefasciatus]|eukprot:XP_001870727.1 conserved hypothetical protein [Culex quinquefasciatus]